MKTPKQGISTSQKHVAPAPPAELGQIVGRLSHDLKAPVMAIAQLTNWIDEELAEGENANKETVAQYMELLKSRSRRLATLVNSLSTFARVGLSEKKFDGSWDALMQEIFKTLPALDTFEISTDFKSAPKVAEQDLIVLFEVLLSNATKHHHLGHGTIRISSHLDENKCVLTFMDDGPGIPADAFGKAVEMFGTLKRQDLVEGNGMGLSIASRIADQYHGELTISQKDGKTGCEVKVRISQ